MDPEADVSSMTEYASPNRVLWVMLVVLVALSAALAMLALSGDQSSWEPLEHPRFSTMQQSGWSWEDRSFLLGWVWLLGTLQISLFLCVLVLGLAKGGCLGPLRIPLLVGGLLYVGCFSFMVLAHLFPVAPSIWSLPSPTTVMLFLLWPLPSLYFVGLYVAIFDSWILTQESHQRFLDLVRARRGEGKE